MDSRRSGSSAGEGASSTTFWWRRWIEHSLSKRCKTLPCESPMTCTSTWRGFLDQLLQKHRPVPERGLGLPTRPPYGLYEVLIVCDGPHPASPAPGAGLDQDGEADATRLLSETVFIVILAVVAGDRRHACLARQLLGADLESDGVHRLWRRPDPGRAGRLDGPGELGALREETVARMHGFRPRPLDRLHEPPDVQVALRCRGWAEEVRLVGEAPVHRAFVRLRVDGDALYAKLPAGADDADRYLAAVGDEDAVEAHRLVLQPGSRFSRKAANPSWPSSPVRSSEITRVVRPGASIGSVVSRRRSSAFIVACATGPPCRISPTFSSTAASSSTLRRDLVNEADLARPFGTEAFPGDEQGPGVRGPDLAHDER